MPRMVDVFRQPIGRYEAGLIKKWLGGSRNGNRGCREENADKFHQRLFSVFSRRTQTGIFHKNHSGAQAS